MAPQAQSAFFHRLNADCRHLIYSYVERWPLKARKKWVGIYMSCRQAKAEIDAETPRILRQYIDNFTERSWFPELRTSIPLDIKLEKLMKVNEITVICLDAIEYREFSQTAIDYFAEIIDLPFSKVRFHFLYSPSQSHTQNNVYDFMLRSKYPCMPSTDNLRNLLLACTAKLEKQVLQGTLGERKEVTVSWAPKELFTSKMYSEHTVSGSRAGFTDAQQRAYTEVVGADYVWPSFTRLMSNMVHLGYGEFRSSFGEETITVNPLPKQHGAYPFICRLSCLIKIYEKHWEKLDRQYLSRRCYEAKNNTTYHENGGSLAECVGKEKTPGDEDHEERI